MIKLKCPEGKCEHNKFICCHQCDDKPCRDECNIAEDECDYFIIYQKNFITTIGK